MPQHSLGGLEGGGGVLDFDSRGGVLPEISRVYWGFSVTPPLGLPLIKCLLYNLNVHAKLKKKYYKP